MNMVYKKQQGMSLVSAIFILVALASIGAAMVTLSTTSATTSTLNIEQQRAYYAARSAMEWAIKTVADNDSSFNSDSCSGLGSLTVLENFSITISCSATCPNTSCCSDNTQCSLTPRVSVITITASKGNSGEIYRISRTIQTTTSYDGS